MSLTVGTSLQSGKYVIQAVLDQSDFGITYQAIHVYLDQSVILQTLESNPADPERLARFQQQFLAGVRQLSKGEHFYSYPGKVLDYFTEAQLPYVVMEYIPGQPLPKVLDWLLLPQKVDLGNTNEIQDQIYTELGNASQSQLIADRSDGAIASAALVTQTANGAVMTGAISNGFHASTQLNQDPATVMVSPNGGKRSPHFVKRKTSPWVPASLMLTTVIAGLAGAGFGWTLRFHPATQDHPIFQNEQAFPPTQGWPIQEEGDRSFSPSEWERSNDEVNEAPVRQRPSAQEVAPTEPIGEDKIQLPEAEAIPKIPSEFEGGDPFPPELPPDPTAETLPPEPSYDPPIDNVPAPEIEVAPVAPEPISPPAEPPLQ